MERLPIPDELIEFIRKRTLYPVKYPITTETSVEDDLGVTGDDSIIFMEAFFKKFDVEPADFNCIQYFEGEGVFNPFSAFARLIFRKANTEYTRMPLTVGILQRAIELGKWDSERLKEPDSSSSKE
ncbi:DUF1493 family protein [Paraburkholderia adhaesiva]|uniref:DUF1493 family protein n=1 Tax=Paraburkholderia adhaesiva TaxID=2883244 RepID=UPI001F3302B7|nr:DUF1493 family protein [Paraburkholderia adhaesiva]